MTFPRASLHFAAELDEPGYQWPAAALESFLRQNAAREDPVFTRYMLDAYQEWRVSIDQDTQFVEPFDPPAASVASIPTDKMANMDDTAIGNPFNAFCNVSDVTMRGFIRLLSHRISFATATVLTGLERSEVEALATSLRAWLVATQPAQDLQDHIQLGFDPLASELTCPHCASSKAPVFFGLSWHHIQVYRCDTCGQLFEAHQGLREDATGVPGNDALSHSHV
ncbi:hypothetical protein BH10PSE18_BH10PSE18_04140 [soil metagenome]